MRRTFSFAALTVCTIAVAGFLMPRDAQAITIIPPSFEYKSAKPGDTITDKAKLFNGTDKESTYFATTAVFSAKDDTGTPLFSGEGEGLDLAGWITVDDGPYTVPPGDRIEVPFTIKVPTSAEPGGHFATIFFSNRPPASTGNGSEVFISEKVGALVFLRIEGNVIESAKIKSFTTTPKKETFNRVPINFEVLVENTGNVHVRPTGTLTVRNMLGGTTIDVPLNPALGAVLPRSNRRFDGVWDKGEVSTPSNFFKEIGNEWRNFALGSYTATATMTYGLANDKTIQSSIQFWVFPWRLLLLTLIIIVAIVWLLVVLVKRYNTWVVSKASQAQKK